MELDMQRSNYPPTTAEIARLNEFVKSRSQHVIFLRKSISDEEVRITSCLDAIQNLTEAISRGKAAVSSYEADLQSFSSIRDRLKVLTSTEKLAMRPEESSERLYLRMRDCAMGSIDSRQVLVQEQVELVRTELRALIDAVRSLELELRGWKNTLNLATSAKESLLDMLVREELVVANATTELSPVRCIPDELWRYIFRLTVYSEINQYFNVDQTEPLTPTQLHLAHVCRRWRDIVQNEAILWNFVYRPASQKWSTARISLFKACLSHSDSPLTVVSNITHAHFGHEVASSERHVLQRDRRYTLHINMFSDQKASLERMKGLNSCKPSALIITCRRPLHNDYISETLPRFPSVTSLSILTRHPRTIFQLDLGLYYPNITKLRIECTHWMVPSVPFLSLRLTLEELYVRFETSVPLDLDNSIEFPRLRKLGLGGQPIHYLLPELRMPKLISATFYGEFHNPGYFLFECFIQSRSTDRKPEDVESEPSDLSEIIFENWQNVPFDDAYRGCIDVFRSMIHWLNSLQSLKFVDCVFDGEMLVDLIQSAQEDQNEASLSELKEITFGYCSGITRDHCDRLAQLVDKLNIYY